MRDVSISISDDLIFAFDPSVDETPAKGRDVSLMDPCGDPDGMSIFHERDLWTVSRPCGQDGGADQTERNAGNDQQSADAYIGGRTHRGN